MWFVLSVDEDSFEKTPVMYKCKNEKQAIDYVKNTAKDFIDHDYLLDGVESMKWDMDQKDCFELQVVFGNGKKQIHRAINIKPDLSYYEDDYNKAYIYYFSYKNTMIKINYHYTTIIPTIRREIRKYGLPTRHTISSYEPILDYTVGGIVAEFEDGNYIAFRIVQIEDLGNIKKFDWEKLGE